MLGNVTKKLAQSEPQISAQIINSFSGAEIFDSTSEEDGSLEFEELYAPATFT